MLVTIAASPQRANSSTDTYVTPTLSASTFDLPFRADSTPMVAACNTIVQPRTETKVRVTPDPAYHDTALSEKARWSIVTGCHSEDRRVTTGILRICDLKNDE
jgi:hypothetical protein